MAAAFERLVSDQDRDPVPRDGGERLERRDRCACRRRVGTRALDVERGREARPLPRSHEAQRLVLRGRDRAHRLELFEGTHQREVARGDVAENEQAHSACNVLCGHRVRSGRGGPRAQPSAQVELPRDAERRRSCLGVRNIALDGVVVAGAVIERARRRTDARKKGGTADGFAAARGSHAFHRDLDVAILARSAADELREHGVAEAFPPGDVGLGLGRGRRRELARHVDRRLQHGRRASGQDERERHRERLQAWRHALELWSWLRVVESVWISLCVNDLGASV